MLDWLIVGGGVHGTLLSHHLTVRGGGVRVRVLDPHPRPLWAWGRFTSACGMHFLRSPGVHHLDVDPFGLRRFAKRRARGRRSFLPPYDRPAHWLFQAHCDWLVERHHLSSLREVGRARGLVRVRGGLRVETEAGALEARRVVLALGLGEAPHWPVWAAPLRDAAAPVEHVLSPGFDREATGQAAPLLVVGGGSSALQLALALSEVQPGRVTLLCRHPLREHPFDSDAGWLGPRRLAGFWRVQCHAERRRLIRQARLRGSAPGEVVARVRGALQEGRLALLTGEVVEAEPWSAPGPVRLHAALASGARVRLEAERVVLATGFEGGRPGGAWLEEAIRELGLLCAGCGYPLVPPSLEWAAGLYVTGPLAELELGPVSRNIAGARMAAERLLKAA